MQSGIPYAGMDVGGRLKKKKGESPGAKLGFGRQNLTKESEQRAHLVRGLTTVCVASLPFTLAQLFYCPNELFHVYQHLLQTHSHTHTNIHRLRGVNLISYLMCRERTDEGTVQLIKRSELKPSRPAVEVVFFSKTKCKRNKLGGRSEPTKTKLTFIRIPRY